MTVTKLKAATAVLALLVGTGGMAFGQAGGRAEPAPKPPEDLASVARKMDTIKDRLKDGRGGEKTQKLQKEVVARLDEIIKELKAKGKKEAEPINLTAELRLLRAMQARVNHRTALYAKHYKGERVPDPETADGPEQRERFETIRRELKELAVRQEKVAKITRTLAKLIE